MAYLFDFNSDELQYFKSTKDKYIDNYDRPHYINKIDEKTGLETKVLWFPAKAIGYVDDEKLEVIKEMLSDDSLEYKNYIEISAHHKAPQFPRLGVVLKGGFSSYDTGNFWREVEVRSTPEYKEKKSLLGAIEAQRDKAGATVKESLKI